MEAFLIVLLTLISRVEAGLPNLPDCQRLEDAVLDTADPRAIFGTNNELGARATPVRVGNLRSRGPIPSHHFASNELKSMDRLEPMRVFPYEAILDGKEGVVYDAYTMERWYDPKRTDLMEQQSTWETGRPWVKLNNMGSNMKQMVSGPDGNPFGVFSGQSGIRLGMKGSGDPVLTDFGDLYANFLFTGGGGSMEVPVVRGATLNTHIYKNVNPVIKPYCMSSINGQPASFACPVERSAADGGAGYLDGSCHGGVLTIRLHNSKAFSDWKLVQWAASPSGEWRNPGMHNCDAATCKLTDGGKTVEMTIHGARGSMSFAINLIGSYVLPWDWSNKPMTTTCTGRKREAEEELEDHEHEENKRGDVGRITASAVCKADRSLTIQIDLADNDIKSIDMVQFAVAATSVWHDGYVPGMSACDGGKCSRAGSVVTIHTQAPATQYEFAVNIVGLTVLPAGGWIEHPFKGVCDGSTVGTGTGTNNPGGTNQPSVVTFPPQVINSNTKFIIELNEPGSRLPGQTRKFVLYFSKPVAAHVNPGTSEVTFQPQAGGAYTGIVQLGYLGAGPRGDNSKYNYLDKYKGRYSYKPQVESCVSDSRQKGYLSFVWNPVNDNGQPTGDNLLMVALPHQELILRKNFASHLQDSVYGFKTYEGNDWLLEYDVLHTPVAPDTDAVNRIKQNAAENKDILDAIARDFPNVNMDGPCAHSDSYNVGKGIGLVARLASISRAFGTNHYQQLDQQIERCLNKWLRVDDTLDNMWKFKYDTVWGGLFLRATNGALDFGVDYGFPYYNDHHFHLGYFLYAMAYYVKHNAAWGQQHKDRIYAIARDVGNPSHKDPYFPVVRHQDYYYGFSWASGVAPGERQEESSSESINCYHGLAALGDAFNDPKLKHAGQLHLAMEIASVREYWQVRAHNRPHFPPMLQKFGVVGQIAEGAWYVYTLDWPCDPNRFPMRHGCLLGIQTIPITAVARYWIDQEWAGSIKETCELAINPALAPDYSRVDRSDPDFRVLTTGWQAFCYAAMAPLDAEHRRRAADYLRNKRPQDLVGGTGSASTLLFIYGST